MLNLVDVRNRLLAAQGAASTLRDVQITANVEEAMRESVRATRCLLLDLGESFGASAAGSYATVQQARAEIGVLIAVPDPARKDQSSPLHAPRLLVRQALLGWAPEGFTAFVAARGRLLAAGPVLWWMDSFSTEYIVKGA